MKRVRGRRPGQLDDTYREYSGELIGYAAVLEGPAAAAEVVSEAVARLRSGNERDVSRGDLYRSVYEAARERRSGTLDSLTHSGVPAHRMKEVQKLASLSLDERAALFLSDGVGLKPGMVGQQLGLSEANAEAIHARARQKLNGGQIGSRKETRAVLGQIVNQAGSPPVDRFDDTQDTAKRYRSPRIIVLLAIATAVALIAPYPFLTGNSIAPVTTAPSDAAPAGAVSFRGIVYLLQDPPGQEGGLPSLVAFEVSTVDLLGVLEPGDDELAFLTKMSDLDIALPSADSDAPTAAAFYSMVPSQTRIQEVSTVTWGGVETLVLDMNPEFLDGTGSGPGDVALLNQIVYTATHDEPSKGVWLTVGGSPIEDFGGDAIDISTPLHRDSLRDGLNPIVITEPVTVDVTDQTVAVQGLARTSTGSVSYALVSSQFGEVGQDSSAISCGPDCWGEFRFVLPASAMPPGGIIRVFEAGEDVESHRVDLYMPSGFDGRWDLSR